MLVSDFGSAIYFGCVRLETFDKGGISLGSGTGFIVRDTQKEGSAYFLVTNKHVVRDARVIEFFVTKAEEGSPVIGSAIKVRLLDPEGGAWFGLQDPEIDITIANISANLEGLFKKEGLTFIKGVSRDMVPTLNEFRELGGVGDVLFVGYPKGLMDERNFLPITRRGITATPPFLNFQGKRKFLIDAAVFEGSSGSPVFWVSNIGQRQSQVYFLGLISATLQANEEGEVRSVDIPTARTKAVVDLKNYLNLGVVEKAEALFATIDEYFENYRAQMVQKVEGLVK